MAHGRSSRREVALAYLAMGECESAAHVMRLTDACRVSCGEYSICTRMGSRKKGMCLSTGEHRASFVNVAVCVLANTEDVLCVTRTALPSNPYKRN